jgi:hypothetical protein
MATLPLLLLAALSAAAPATRPDPGALGGLAFDLPPGFVRRDGLVDGQPVALAGGPGGEAVAVLLLDAPAPLECGRADGAPRGLAPLRTRGGIDGCLAVVLQREGAVALARLSSRRASATLAVLAPDEVTARRLALEVAGSFRAQAGPPSAR